MTSALHYHIVDNHESDLGTSGMGSGLKEELGQASSVHTSEREACLLPLLHSGWF